MAYTSHGWHIPGTSLEEPPRNRARCGGIKICPECKDEMVRISPYLDAPIESSEVYDQISSASLSDEERKALREEIATDLRSQAVARFDQYGPSDERGAAFWDAAGYVRGESLSTWTERVSLSDEDLRLECLALAVELKARRTQVDRPTNTVEIAKLFFDYVRPKGD